MTEENFDITPLKTAQRICLDLVQMVFYQPLADPESKLREILAILKLSSNRRLRSLTLRNNFSRSSFDMTPFIPCSGLLYLDFGTCEEHHCSNGIDMSSFANVLKQCPSLQVLKTTLDLGKPHAYIPWRFPEGDIVHNHMREVSLCLQHIMTGGYRAATFLPIIFPSLRVSHLQFTGKKSWQRDPDPVQEPPILCRTLQAASLTSLTIQPRSLLEANLILALVGLPDLVQLHLLEVPNGVDIDQLYGPEIIRFLCPPQPGDTTEDARGCSKLQYLKLGKNSTTIDDAILPELLYGRQVCVRQCHIHFRLTKDVTSGAELEGFSDLVAAGLDLKLRYGDARVLEKMLRGNRLFSQVDRLVYGWDVEL